MKKRRILHIIRDIGGERSMKFIIIDAIDDIVNSFSKLRSAARNVLKSQKEKIVTSKDINETVESNLSNLIILNMVHRQMFL